MIAKKIIFLSTLLFIYSCGFSPIYKNLDSVNFNVVVIETSGESEINNYIKSNLKRFNNKKSNKEISISMNSTYKKNVLAKDSTGKNTDYISIVETIFIIKNKNRKISIKRTFNFKSIDDKFEEANYEKIIKQNLSKIISNELISQLSRFK